MRGTAIRAIAPLALACSVSLFCLSACVGGPATPLSQTLSPAVVDRVALCGGGLKEDIGAGLRLAVARDVATSGSLSLTVQKSLRAAIVDRVQPADVVYVYEQYTACVTNRAENDKYLATLKSRRAEFADQLQRHSIPNSLSNHLLSLADQEISLYQAAKFIDARNVRKAMVTDLMNTMLDQPSSRWMIQYTLSEERRRTVRRRAVRPTLTPVQICTGLLRDDPYCRSPEFIRRAEANALIERARSARCAFLVGPERLPCEMQSEADNH